MRTIRMALLALPLAGCGQGFHDQMTCRHAAGPEPGASLMLFGLAGAAIMVGLDDHQLWQSAVDGCVRKVRMTLRD